ncbi:hypothetical protein Xmlh_21045 [Xanthomonas axonopodis pv. melhusii]|uniref:Uncharacterized protein n=1 Tax=Xanthomonas axonopodis pv. melhusii TaxID=487834 RepID=A0A1T1NNR8_9XANT|nr:hypothetical protein Xmlh_21045 [Xanthomonas axonopodis pv. melhusii]
MIGAPGRRARKLSFWGMGLGIADCAESGSAAGDRLLGSKDILSDSPSRHIPVPLSADLRPRYCFGTLLM